MRVTPMIEEKVKSGLKGRIKELLRREYNFISGEKIQEMFAEDLIKLVEKTYRDPFHIQVGQVLWLGVKEDQKPRYGQRAATTEKVPVVLTLIAEEDIEMLKGGMSPSEIRKYRAARLFKEAREQNALLSHSDVAFLLNISYGTVGRDVRTYMEKTQEILPTRAIVHDIGPVLTHKKLIVQLYLKGYHTPEIARITQHSEQACDRYIQSYRRVRRLWKDGKDISFIQRTLGMTKRLVEEYVQLYQNMEERSNE